MIELCIKRSLEYVMIMVMLICGEGNCEGDDEGGGEGDRDDEGDDDGNCDDDGKGDDDGNCDDDGKGDDDGIRVMTRVRVMTMVDDQSKIYCSYMPAL